MVLTALAFACGDIQSGEKTALGPFSEAYTMEGVSGMLFATRPVALRGRTLMFALLLPLRRRLLGLPIENLVAREGLRGSLAITALTIEADARQTGCLAHCNFPDSASVFPKAQV